MLSELLGLPRLSSTQAGVPMKKLVSATTNHDVILGKPHIIEISAILNVCRSIA
jgi:hypothetical protein